MKCPCHGCERRTLTCRQVCKEHEKWQKEHAQAKERERMDRDADSYRIGVCIKIRGRKKR